MLIARIYNDHESLVHLTVPCVEVAGARKMSKKE